MCYEIDSKSKNSINSILQYSHVVQKDSFVVFTTSRFPYVILCPNVMTVQTSKGKVPHIYKELIIRIIGFEYEKLLLLKSSQNRVASNISTTRKKQYKSDISYIPGVFWDKVKKYKNKYTVKKYFIRWWW